MTPDNPESHKDYITFSNRIALLIGISEYLPPWEELPYVLNDVREERGGLHRVLKDSLGARCFPPSSIYLLTGKVSQRDMQVFLAKRLLSDPGIDKQTLVLVYFSGHVDIDSEIGNVPCFVCSQTELANLGNTSVTFRWLVEDILKNTSASVMLMVDACFSGKLLDFDWPENVAVFVSSAHDKKSFADTNTNRSHFTELLIRGLQGEAGDEAGNVTTHSLFRFLDNQLRICGMQEPQSHSPKKPFLLASHWPSNVAISPSSFDEKTLLDWAERFVRHCKADPLMTSEKAFVRSRAFKEIISNREGNRKTNGGQANAEQEQRTPVYALDELITWVRSDSNFLLLLADTGIGKTVVLKRLAYEFCLQVIDSKYSRFPLFLNLRMYLDTRLDNPATLPNRTKDQESQRRFRAILIDWLQNELGIPILWRDFVKLLKDGKLLLLLDGFDEMCRDASYEVIRECLSLLSIIQTRDSKIALSARTHFFSSERSMFNAFHSAGIEFRNAQLLTLRKFEESDIEQLVLWRLGQNEQVRWRQMVREERLGVDYLCRRPFLLDFLIKFIQNDEDYTPSKVYDSLLSAWYERDEWRFKQFLSDFKEEIERNLSSLYSYVFKNSESVTGEEVQPPTDVADAAKTQDKPWHESVLEHFLEILALRMRNREGDDSEGIHADNIADEIQDCFQLMPNIFLNFFEYCIRTCSFMARSDDGCYSFIHDSVQAYFAARHIRNELNATRFQWDETSRSKGKPVPVIPWGLGSAPVFQDKYLLEFLLDYMHEKETRKIQQIINDSEMHARVYENPHTLFYLYGNALTLLYHKFKERKIPRVLNKKNISGVCFNGANLQGFSFRECLAKDVDFHEADLTGCDLVGAQFVNVDFHSAILKNVRINGESVVRLINNQKLSCVSSPSENFKKVYSQSLAGKGRNYREKTIEGLSELINIPGGRFMMGSDSLRFSIPRERPPHEAIIPAFLLEKHPVTNLQFKKFVDANPEWRKDAVIDRMKMPYYLKFWVEDSFVAGEEHFPVVYVNWYAAEAYAKWAGRRLPTEAEWEFALRGGKHDYHYIYPWGDLFEQSPKWFRDKFFAERKLYPVDPDGPSNKYGLIDMSGNVNEWVQDWYDNKYYEFCGQETMKTKKPKQNPICDHPDGNKLKVLRGGSWLDDEKEFRHFACHYRAVLNPLNTNQDGGFRCAMDIDDRRR